MRLASVLILSALVGSAVWAQEAASPTGGSFQLHTLTLVAPDLPDATKARVGQALQGATYEADELTQRIDQMLRNAGYYSAQAGAPQVSIVGQAAPPSANVSVPVESGPLYTMGEIKFSGATQFKSEQLRAVFPCKAGEAYNGSSIDRGIEAVKGMYEAKGFVDIGAVPVVQVDDESHVIGLLVNIEEGQPYEFGQLILDGTEPAPGVSAALQASWRSLQGTVYNPELLKKWLAKSTATWPKGSAAHTHAEGEADTNAHLVNLQFHFQ